MSVGIRSAVKQFIFSFFLIHMRLGRKLGDPRHFSKTTILIKRASIHFFMSIATKTGDKGETSLLGGERIRKNDVRIEAYGTVDELNAALGVALAYVEGAAIKEVLTQVQHDLFTVGAEIAAMTSKQLTMEIPRIMPEHLEFIDTALVTTENLLPTQRAFILPNGTGGAAHLHLARTICRRAERRVVACTEFNLNPEIIKYLNRLGDLLFLFARAENQGKTDETVVKY